MNRMMIWDLRTFTVDNVDLDLVEAKLWRIVRFQGHPGALSVRQHTGLARDLAIRGNEVDEVVEWCFHHDDHEAVVGDINGCAVRLVNGETDTLESLTRRIDMAICKARKIDFPDRQTRARVHIYDKLAESLEWQFGLGYVDTGHHPDWPKWLDQRRARDLFEKAKAATKIEAMTYTPTTSTTRPDPGTI